MKNALYVTSLHAFSGKTSLCLGLGRHFQDDGLEVGYLKPLSTQSWQTGQLIDEDAVFVRRVLKLAEMPQDLVGVVLTRELLMGKLTGESTVRLIDQVKKAFARVSGDKDIVLLEGGASLRDGFSVGLGTPIVAESMDVPALAVSAFSDRLSLLDDFVVARLRLGENLIGVVANEVPENEIEFIEEVARPYLERRGIPLLGILPMREELQAISIAELAEILNGEFLVGEEQKGLLIENLVVGAMHVAQALPRIRRIAGTKAVITGGDRVDMHYAALETSVSCLILTGHLRPNAEVLSRAEELGVAVLLVRENTMETVEAIERVFGKTRLGQPSKLQEFETLLTEHFDFERLYAGLNE